MSISKLSEDWMQFIQESEALTGIISFNPERGSTKRHIEMCVIIANASRFLDPRFVNGLITGKHREYDSLLRSGTEGAVRTIIPSAERMRIMLGDWVQDAESMLLRMVHSAEYDITEEAWRMHDRLICIHPFKTGNGRTARIMFNHLRCLLGLKVYVIRDQEAREYFSRLERYRGEKFLPLLAKAT